MKRIFSEIPLKYLAGFVLVILFIFRVIDANYDIKQGKNEEKVVNIIQNIKSGSKVLIMVNFGPEAKYELEEPLSAVIGYFAKKDVGIVFVTLIPTGIETAFMAVERSISKPDFAKDRYVYGQDYVHIGYVAGASIGTFLISSDLYSIRKKDIYGNVIDTLPVMNGIETLDDFGAVIEFSSNTVDGVPGMTMLSVFAGNTTIPKIAICSSDMVLNYLPFYLSGSFDGFIGGFKSVAGFTKAVEPFSEIGKRYFLMSVVLLSVLLIIVFAGISRLVRGEK